MQMSKSVEYKNIHICSQFVHMSLVFYPFANHTNFLLAN